MQPRKVIELPEGENVKIMMINPYDGRVKQKVIFNTATAIQLELNCFSIYNRISIYEIELSLLPVKI